MNTRHIYRTLIPLTLGIAALLFIFAIGAHDWFFAHRDERYYYGHIIEVSDRTLVLEDKGRRKEVIIITPDTRIKEGMQERTGVQVGEQTIVIGSMNEAGVIEASVIRVLDEER